MVLDWPVVVGQQMRLMFLLQQTVRCQCREHFSLDANHSAAADPIQHACSSGNTHRQRRGWHKGRGAIEGSGHAPLPRRLLLLAASLYCPFQAIGQRKSDGTDHYSNPHGTVLALASLSTNVPLAPTTRTTNGTSLAPFPFSSPHPGF